jgi:capsular polysaccharide biosynthesis protein
VLLVVLTAAGAVTGWAISRSQATEYEASTSVLVRYWAVETYVLTGQGTQVTSQDISGAAIFASSDEVLDRTVQTLADGRTADDLDITATPLVAANAVQIVATAESAADAQEISSTVADAMVAVLQDRIVDTASGLADATDSGDRNALTLLAEVEQRVQVLTEGVQPLVPLTTSDPEKTSPTGQLPWILGIIGLAAGALIATGLLFSRPAINRPRDAQRLTGVPAVSTGGSADEDQAGRIVRHLLKTRTEGKLLVIPVDDATDKSALAFAERVRGQLGDSTEEARIESVPEPAAAVLAPRPVGGQVAAVLLLVPKGISRRALTDAVALLESWHPVDAVVVTA